MNSSHTSRLRRAVISAIAIPLFSIVALAGSNPVLPSTANSNGPIEVDGLRIDNFGVCAGRIYRGEQPKARDFKALASLGITTVIDLRLDAEKDSRALAEAAGLTYVNIPIDDHKQPTDADVERFFALLDAAPNEKVYVHCAGGRHRTGSMIAIYRMAREGWTVEQAYDEMKAYDFYTRFGHKGFKTYVFDYYERMMSDPTSVPVAYTPEKQ